MWAKIWGDNTCIQMTVCEWCRKQQRMMNATAVGFIIVWRRRRMLLSDLMNDGDDGVTNARCRMSDVCSCVRWSSCAVKRLTPYCPPLCLLVSSFLSVVSLHIPVTSVEDPASQGLWPLVIISFLACTWFCLKL